ncbi:mannose-6-phosphate isomerase [Shimwellia blattae]|uniref:Mannose-6-phosphate isomerase n=1 Tax=Shimwellia blattae (strain ATCC 29907 / DSM 4481 / JCM 1650 / NBRC 105725 / CDC 9005-74) TaxID=630626 RepID=I2B9Y4_SHIBC|nr:mannose-6-phosphate isomerase [Shimwellia blattae]AFJ47338.1 mannose-6-phosphate isomerase [Shimwellia blattae DSM 4481 = NBRC 105725]GAB80467.1 mannose-6-phosphate isomerase [Shimwellia blattae DSM 4481 = NBRC 105725]VDY64835.1 Mannose-6-phosphate isomerase [Shimwellia blattae]VEC22948.1 Mannose-6-phosphate isomerase [Shimwellia blattae]
MQRLHNAIQHYAWGSKTALTELYGIHNPDQQPMAELWMGAHPKSSSTVQSHDGVTVSLRECIAADPAGALGSRVAARFGELPFLFKVLCAAQPLSIQVHPSKPAAEAGFARENSAGIPLDAAHRNYKDPNHKPELVFALTPFRAMNGFRVFSEIAALLAPVAAAHPLIGEFIRQPDAGHLRRLFGGLLGLNGAEKAQALAVLRQALQTQSGEPWDTVRAIAEFYPDDSGLFSPLLLNVIQLQPAEAMFLSAETPHAYLNGVGLEVMANSDNVLRAGLTPKYMDIPELLANVQFVAKPADQLLAHPQRHGDELDFPVPVEDFAFSLHTLHAAPAPLDQESAAIVFCVAGEARLQKENETLVLRPGESAFISASEAPVSISGQGTLARVYNVLN